MAAFGIIVTFILAVLLLPFFILFSEFIWYLIEDWLRKYNQKAIDERKKRTGRPW